MAKEEKTVVAFKHTVNEARGEVRLVIDDVELVIAATLGGLSAVSSRLQCKSLNDLFTRLSGVEVSATEAAIALLTVKGDAIEALTKLRLKHFLACASAFTAALSHHFDGDEGNDLAAPAA
ncbi:hypothetical protein [Rhizobium leucaenae]|uniref:hypothetical protein n=1 Tax=Rhizobium leucaenae TaxID=29450 RepID=UPI0007EE5B2D|nr:hypothetical protein [Rhizobium leucaenae]